VQPTLMQDLYYFFFYFIPPCESIGFIRCELQLISRLFTDNGVGQPGVKFYGISVTAGQFQMATICELSENIDAKW